MIDGIKMFTINVSKLWIIVTVAFVFILGSGCEPSSNVDDGYVSPSEPPQLPPPNNERFIGWDQFSRPHFVDKQGREYLLQNCSLCRGSGDCENCKEQVRTISLAEALKKNGEDYLASVGEDSLENLYIQRCVTEMKIKIMEWDSQITRAEQELRNCSCKGKHICPACQGAKEFKVYL